MRRGCHHIDADVMGQSAGLDFCAGRAQSGRPDYVGRQVNAGLRRPCAFWVSMSAASFPFAPSLHGCG